MKLRSGPFLTHLHFWDDSQNKNDKADMVDDLKKCQSIFRESCIKTGVGTNYNKKLGCATPEE